MSQGMPVALVTCLMGVASRLPILKSTVDLAAYGYVCTPVRTMSSPSVSGRVSTVSHDQVLGS